MSHKCHARGCPREVSPQLLLCPAHWRRVPADLRREVWRNYRRGQEQDKQPTEAYLKAARAAVDAVAKVEGKGREPNLF